MDSSASNSNSNYSLNNSENYKTTIADSCVEIVNKYFSLTNEYLTFIIENANFKNAEYKKFIIERGLETITHVFTVLLYFSRNLDLAYYHSQKAFYFYVEFIGQISEDKHTFLQLSSRDACMFVYKKTIFELSNDSRKNATPLSENNVGKLDILNMNISIIKSLTSVVLEKDHKMTKQIAVVCNEILKTNLSKSCCQLIEMFVKSLTSDIQVEKYFELIQLFISRYSKMKPEMKYNISETKIKEKFADAETFNNKLNEPSSTFVKWILA